MKEKIIQTEQIEINKNTFRFGNSVIQISNISRFRVGPEPEEKYPDWAVKGLFLAFLLFIVGSIYDYDEVRPLLFICGFVVGLICVGVLWMVYNNNQNLGEYIIFDLNCGDSLLFVCKNTAFLKEIADVMVNCFNSEIIHCKIDINNSRIDNLQIAGGDMIQNSSVAGRDIIQNSTVVGDENTGISGVGTNNTVKDVNTTVLDDKDDWIKAAEIFTDCFQRYFKDSEESMCCYMASQYCYGRNESGLRELISDKKDIFKSIFFNAASTGISEIIKRLIGSF